MNFTARPSATVSETTYNRFRPYSDSSGRHSRETPLLRSKPSGVKCIRTQYRCLDTQYRCLANFAAWWVLIRTKPVVGCLGHCCWWSYGKVQCLLLIAKNISTLLKMAVMNAGCIYLNKLEMRSTFKNLELVFNWILNDFALHK